MSSSCVSQFKLSSTWLRIKRDCILSAAYTCRNHLLIRAILIHVWRTETNIFINIKQIFFIRYLPNSFGDCRGRDCMVVGFTITYAIGAYRHWCCEFESCSGRDIQHYVIKFVSDLRQVRGFLRVLRFPPPIKLTVTI